MVVVTHMVDVVESLTDNTHHNYENNPPQSLEDEATNSFEKPAPNLCGFQTAMKILHYLESRRTVGDIQKSVTKK